MPSTADDVDDERRTKRREKFFLIWFNLELYVSNVNNRKGNSQAFAFARFGFLRCAEWLGKKRNYDSCSVYEAEKSKNGVKLIVSLINHETFYCQRFNCFEEFSCLSSNAGIFVFRRDISFLLPDDQETEEWNERARRRKRGNPMMEFCNEVNYLNYWVSFSGVDTNGGSRLAQISIVCVAGLLNNVISVGLLWF